MTDLKGEPTDHELSDVDDKLMSRGWINLLDHAGLSFRERQVIGWALRMSPRFRSELKQLRKVRDVARALVEECDGGILSPSLGALARLDATLHAADMARAVPESRPVTPAG